jgi:hypothetical protein
MDGRHVFRFPYIGSVAASTRTSQMLRMRNNAMASPVAELLGSGTVDREEDGDGDDDGGIPRIGARDMKC